MKKTMIIGASMNEERYSYKAAHMLKKHGHEIVPVGLREGEVAGTTIQKGLPLVDGIDTVTLYLGPQNQGDLFDYLLKIKPNRVIFNPGTENEILMNKLEMKGIEPVEACTLVLLSTNQY